MYIHFISSTGIYVIIARDSLYVCLSNDISSEHLLESPANVIMFL